jgi:hypothetical protein
VYKCRSHPNLKIPKHFAVLAPKINPKQKLPSLPWAKAMAPVALKDGHVFQRSERQLLADYLGPKAGLGGRFIPGFVEEGVDVFSLRPRALPFWPVHRRKYGEVWGFFFAARPAAGERCPAPGGCWVRYGPERKYFDKGGVGGGGEAVAFRRLFAYCFT